VQWAGHLRARGLRCLADEDVTRQIMFNCFHGNDGCRLSLSCLPIPEPEHCIDRSVRSVCSGSGVAGLWQDVESHDSMVHLVWQESIARVKSLSLSGKLLYPIADKFMVQWPDLVAKYPRSRYVGFVI
jgi:hypothetical protein